MMEAMPTIARSLRDRAAEVLSPLVLVSGSRNRLETLRSCNVEVEVQSQNTDESYGSLSSPGQIVSHIASVKMASYLSSPGFRPDRLALALDTMVSFNGRMLGKPRDRKDASDMLRSFSGRSQEVVTGFSLYIPAKGTVQSCDSSLVIFSTLTEQIIEDYLDSGEWQGAAGAYRIQKTGWKLIERITGSWTNVVGLPLEAVIRTVQQSATKP